MRQLVDVMAIIEKWGYFFAYCSEKQEWIYLYPFIEINATVNKTTKGAMPCTTIFWGSCPILQRVQEPRNALKQSLNSRCRQQSTGASNESLSLQDCEVLFEKLQNEFADLYKVSVIFRNLCICIWCTVVVSPLVIPTILLLLYSGRSILCWIYSISSPFYLFV
jgi:hypothetical protein